MADLISITNIQSFSLSSNTDSSTDPIRQSIDSYWTYNGSDLIYDTNNTYNESTQKASTRFLNFDFTIQTSEEEKLKLDKDTSLITTSFRRLVEITPRYGQSGNGAINTTEQRFDTYIEQRILPYIDTLTLDYKLDLDTPLEYASNIQNHSTLAGTVNFVYNYGLSAYENATNPDSILESQMNNFYKFIVVPDIETETSSFSTVVTPFAAPLTRKNVTEKLVNNPFGDSPIQDFFINSEGFLATLTPEEKKSKFPFYNEVYFTNPADKLVNDPFKDALKESGLLMAFCDLMNREDFKLSQPGEVTTIVQELLFANSYIATDYNNPQQTSFREFNALRNDSIKLYDIPLMLELMYKAPPKEAVDKETKGESAGPTLPPDTRTLRSKGFLTNTGNADYRVDTISKISPVSTRGINYENALDELVEVINELVANDNNYRDYTEILNGKKGVYQSDVLFYRIKKFEEGSEIPIQNFWIPAEKGYRGIRYIDTQVKYGKMYRYEICAVKFVIGSEYKFDRRDIGLISFAEDVQKYKTQISETIDQLRKIAGFREIVREGTSSLPVGSIEIDDIVYDNILKYLIDNEIDVGLLNTPTVMADGISQIALFADKIITNGTAFYKGQTFSYDNLTEEEKGNLLYIQFVWECLTNTWVLGEGPTEEGRLLDLEKSLKNAKTISLIKRFINDIGESTTRVDFDKLKKSDLTKIREELTKLASNPSNGLSFREDLNPDDSLSARGYAYYSFLDEESSETFVLEGEEITSILPISTADSKDIFSAADKLQRERFELNAFYYDYFRTQMSALEETINKYLDCYDNFVDAASSIDIILDYRRIQKYNLTVETKPTIKFAEMPYFENEGMILDNPPIYPNVNVVTYRGIPDRLSFFMNSGQGQIEIEPTTFSDAEDTFIANYRKSKKLNDFQPILYKSDETENLGTVFEIRRLSDPPENYQSFRNARVNTTTDTIQSGKALPAATFDEIIESNRSYYYIFRVFDRRGIASYPSTMMEIQIVENGGIIYPLIKPYEPKDGQLMATKSLKRLLNVVPRITQVLPPEDLSSFSGASPTMLGSEEEGLFGKQFKLRLTSKQTGKVVDLNLNFKANVVESKGGE